MANATVVIENGVTIGRTGCITLYRDGNLAMEFLTPCEGGYVKFWHGSGPECIGKQITSGGVAVTWPSSDKDECARYIAKRNRVKYYGHEAR